MIPVILGAGKTAVGWLARKSLWPTVALGGAAVATSGMSGKESGLQNFLTNAFSTVTTSWEEAESEARWQGTYKGMYKIMEFLEKTGLGQFFDKFFQALGINTSIAQLKNVAKEGLTEDNTTNLTRESVAQPLEKPLTLTEKITNKFNDIKGKIMGNDFDTAVNFVIDRLEGGDQIVQEPGGGIAKYGINSIANPDVDVANLTRQDAINIYKERYWDAVDADNLPASLRLDVFDAAVNQGPDDALRFLKQSGGDLEIFRDLRGDDYKELAKLYPEKFEDHLDGWMNRLDKVKDEAHTFYKDVEVGASDVVERIGNKFDSAVNYVDTKAESIGKAWDNSVSKPMSNWWNNDCAPCQKLEMKITQ